MLYSNRALCLHKLGRHEESHQDAERCIELKADFVKGYLRGAVALRALKRPSEALALLKRGPNNEECMQMAAELRPEAEAAEKSRIEALPPLERANAEADALSAKGLFEAASERYNEVLASAEPQSALALAARNGRAACRHQLSDYEAVVEDTSAVLALDPLNITALTRRMLALEPLEKYKAALADARAVLQQEPRHQLANKVQHRLGKLVRDLQRDNGHP